MMWPHNFKKHVELDQIIGNAYMCSPRIGYDVSNQVKSLFFI